MLLSIQQKYILDLLRERACVRQDQLHALVQGRFPERTISDRGMEAMLRQLCGGIGDFRANEQFVWLGSVQPDQRRLEAVDVMLELSEKRPQDISVRCRLPELLWFSLEGSSLRLFTVATISGPLHSSVRARDSPGRTVWISDDGAAPPGLKLPSGHFFAARQPDGSHRFYGS